MISISWFLTCQCILTSKPPLRRHFPRVFSISIEVAWRYFRISEVVMGFDLPNSICNFIMSLVSSIPLLTASLRNGHCSLIMSSKTGEKVNLGHLGKDFPLPKRPMRQRKCHALNNVMSSHNALNCCCHFATMSRARPRANSPHWDGGVEKHKSLGLWLS